MKKTPKFLLTISQAIAWRDSLDNEGNEYLHKVDRFVANMKPGEIVIVADVVSSDNFQRFWKTLSYILIATGIDMSFGENYRCICRNQL